MMEHKVSKELLVQEHKAQQVLTEHKALWVMTVLKVQQVRD